MFLSELSYQEKKMFLDLSIHVAKANGVLAAEEKVLISSYCTEMQLPSIELYETEPMETVTAYFELADNKIKRIVVLEILGLAYSDGSFDNDETKVVEKFVNDIGLSKDDYDVLHDAIIDYYSVCKKMAQVIE